MICVYEEPSFGALSGSKGKVNIEVCGKLCIGLSASSVDWLELQ